MASSTVGKPPNGTVNKTRSIKRSNSLLVQGRPPVVAKERASSLKREQSLKAPNDLTAHYNLQLRSPIDMFRVQRRSAKKRGGPVVDSTYERPTSPLLGFHSPLQGRRRMMHAKSCDMTPLRLKLTMHSEADTESNSSDESWNVAAVDLKQEKTDCQIAQLNSSPTSQRRKVWTLERNTSHPSSSSCYTGTANSSATTSRSQSPALLDTSGRPTPDLPLHNVPDIAVSETTHPITPRQASLRLKLLRNSRTCHSTSALYSNSISEVTERNEPILHELLRTERRYLSNLNTLLNTLLPELEDQVAARDLRLLFPCQLELLLDWHKQLLVRLEDRMDQNSDSYGMVGDVFRQMCSRETGNSDFFNMYSAYMNEFKVAMKTLAKYEHSSQSFRQELRLCQQLPECDGLPLSAYLLTPVQRLPRYELLLKDLLKHTPVNHRDSYFLEDAVNLLREELTRLNSSIKSCELACSVSRIRNSGRRSGSIRRVASRGRMAGRQLAKQLMKHIQAISVEDVSIAAANQSQVDEMSKPISTRLKTLSVNEMRDKNLYRSDNNLPSLTPITSIGEQDNKIRRPLSSIERTSSCINLVSGYDQIPEDKKRYSQPVLETLESLPNTPEPTSPCSTMPQSETDDSAAQSSSRVSIYSTASSTSGIGSSNSQMEGLDSTLTLTPSSPHPPSSPVTPHSPTTSPILPLQDITPTNNHIVTAPTQSTPITVATATLPHRPIIISSKTGGTQQSVGSSTSSAQRRWRKRISWAGVFVMPRIMSKKKSMASVPDLATTSKRSGKDISLPMDFRHIQHGFISTTTPQLERDHTH